MPIFYLWWNTIQRLNKHDQYVDNLCSQLGEQYDYILRNVPLYSRRRRLIAEIDILAAKDGKYDIYEVKCSYRITKAKKQLKKIYKLLDTDMPVRNVFFFCGQSGSLITME